MYVYVFVYGMYVLYICTIKYVCIYVCCGVHTVYECICMYV